MVKLMTKPKFNTRFLIIIAMFLMPLSGMGIDIFVPSLPAITQHFHVLSSTAKLTVPFYIFGYGLALLFYGPLSDAWGRKKLVIVGLTLYFISAIGCALSPNITMLLTFRVLLGIFVSAPMITARTLLTDTFNGKKLKDLMNWTVVFWAMGPIVAPMIGGYLQHFFNWRYPFFFLALYVLIGLIGIIFLVPETLENKTHFKPKVMLCNYKKMLTNKIFIASVLVMGLIYSVMTVFNVVGPFLIQGTLKQSALVFGHVALILGIVWFAGQFTNRFLALKYSVVQVTWFYFSIVFAGVALILILAMVGKLSITTIVLPTAIIFYGVAPIFPNLYGRLIACFQEMGGSVSALIGAIFIIISAIGSALGSFLSAKSLAPLSLFYLVVILLMAALFTIWLAPYYRKRG